MQREFPFAYLQDLAAKAIQLKYKDSDMSMVIVLPDDVNGLAALDAKLKETSVASIVQQMSDIKIQVSVPKFKVEFEVSLPETLKKVIKYC